MKRIPEALAEVTAAFAPLAAERVGLADAPGRFLATTLTVRQDSPPFDNSAMDGYAVRARDVSSDGKRVCIGMGD